MNHSNHTSNNKNSFDLSALFNIIRQKSQGNNINSYSKKLVESKVNLIAQKIGEEGVEVAVSAIDHDRFNSSQTRQEIINEVSDLFYHTTALLVKYNITLDEIYFELNQRNKKHE
jgi:phosphoribosyl-ATP pyrophosphohydrolase/phosphoribosyl-AMP cyclohydrolase